MRTFHAVGQMAAPWVLLVLLSEAALAQSPWEDAGALLREGDRLMEQQDHRAALEVYRKAAGLTFGFPIETRLARCLYSLGRLPGAAHHLEQALQLRDAGTSEEEARQAASLLMELRLVLSAIVVECDVTGAVLLVDGREEGQTPFRRRVYLFPGTYRLTLRREGYSDFSTELTLKEGEEQNISVVLKPRRMARLGLRCSEEGAAVMVDSRLVGTTPLPRQLFLEPGSRTVTLVKMGFSTASLVAELRPDEERTLDVRLKPVNMASLRLAGSVPGVAVLVDGVRVGTTPLDGVLFMEPGAHKVTLQKDGLSSASLEVDLARDEEVQVPYRVRPWRPVPAVALLSTAAALGLTGAALYIAGGVQGSEAHERYVETVSPPYPIDQEQKAGYRQEVERAERIIVGGHVVTGLAVAALGASLVMFARSRPAIEVRDARYQRAPGILHLGLAPAVGGGALTVGGALP